MTTEQAQKDLYTEIVGHCNRHGICVNQSFVDDLKQSLGDYLDIVRQEGYEEGWAYGAEDALDHQQNERPF